MQAGRNRADHGIQIWRSVAMLDRLLGICNDSMADCLRASLQFQTSSCYMLLLWTSTKSRVFSFHMCKISMGPVSHNPQVGGLALTAAVRMLQGWSKIPFLESCTICGLGFTENVWGNKAHKFVKMTTQLADRHWEDIIENTESFMNTRIIDSEDEGNSNNNGDAETVAPNPHAFLAMTLLPPICQKPCIVNEPLNTTWPPKFGAGPETWCQAVFRRKA
ncbi:hypothetical protein EI94DRAFT_1701263 [Lactarius quietus]|nr:hypothetical protein EI94DRAFT_1701263 [Lactarius quietus]